MSKYISKTISESFDAQRAGTASSSERFHLLSDPTNNRHGLAEHHRTGELYRVIQHKGGYCLTLSD